MNKKAFTFVEILIALVISSFVAVTAVTAMRIIVSGNKTHQTLTAVTDEIRYAQNLIRTDLNNIYRTDDFAQTRFELFYPEGDDSQANQHIVFYTISHKKARPLQPESDVYEVEYFIKTDPDTDQSSLMRRYCPVVPGVAVDEEKRPAGILMPIAQNIIGLQVRCFDGTEWNYQWNTEYGKYPDIVEIVLMVHDPESEKTIKRSIMANVPRLADSSESSTTDSDEDTNTNYDSYMNSDSSNSNQEGSGE